MSTPCEDDLTETVANLTCRVLPGKRTHEYTVASGARPLTLLDLLWIGALSVATWLLPHHYRIGIGILMSGWLWLKLRMVKQESILVMHNVGIQVKTEYWGGGSVSRFIPRATIEDVVINEAITFWQVKPYLAILVKDDERVVVVFENLLPKLHPVLLKVYHGTRQAVLDSEFDTSTPLYLRTSR